MDRVPTKVAFFAWEATWGKVLTLDRLQRRGWQFPNCCFLCGCAEESVKEVLFSWRGHLVGKKRKKIWKAIPLCIFWTVWKEMNRLAFKGGVLHIQKLKNFFVCNLWGWARLDIEDNSLSLLGFLEWLAST